MNAIEFTAALDAHLSPLVRDERTVVARFKSSKGFTTRPFQSSIVVNYINLPETRHRQKRGGGAESENNRMMFMIGGFGEEETDHTDKVVIEQHVNALGDPWGTITGVRTSRPTPMRKKTASPEKIAEYLGGSDAFDLSITDFSERYADQNEKDYQEFVTAVRSGRLEALEGV